MFIIDKLKAIVVLSIVAGTVILAVTTHIMIGIIFFLMGCIAYDILFYQEVSLFEHHYLHKSKGITKKNPNTK